ncbi:SWEET3, partial [Symbiodinium microadriaticum]
MFADLILESLATCLAFFFMTSPLTQAIDVIRTPAKVKHINPANLLGFFLNCMTQLGYGIFMPIPPMIRCNVYGVAVGLFSIATCWYFALGTANAERWNAQACVGTISVLALSGLIFAYAGLGGEGAAARVGSLGILVSIIMYAAPLSVLREVLQTKSSKALPGPQIFMGFLNSLCWFAVGIRRQKMPVWVPNVIVMLLSLAQLALILKFPDRPESVEEQRKDDALLLPVALVNGARSFQNAVSSGKAQREMVPALLSASDRLADARQMRCSLVLSNCCWLIALKNFAVFWSIGRQGLWEGWWSEYWVLAAGLAAKASKIGLAL